MSDNGCTANCPEEYKEPQTYTTNWLKLSIEALRAAEPNQGNENIEMTTELRDVFVDNLKKLDEYIAQLEKKPDIYSNASLEFLSEQVHNAQWEEKKRQGFHAPLLTHTNLICDKFTRFCDHCHTDMYPYSELPEHIKEYDRVTVRTVLEAIKKMEET